MRRFYFSLPLLGLLLGIFSLASAQIPDFSQDSLHHREMAVFMQANGMVLDTNNFGNNSGIRHTDVTDSNKFKSVMFSQGISLARQGPLQFFQNVRPQNYDLIPGPQFNSMVYDYDSIAPQWNHVWKIRRSRIDSFIMDFNAGQLNLGDYPQIASWPGNGDTAVGMPWQVAPFFDKNGNGTYEPHLGEHPDIKGDYAMYTVSHVALNNQPVSVDVHKMIYGFACEPLLEDVLFVDYRIVNRNNGPLQTLYLGLFSLGALGSDVDDFVGVDSTRDTYFFYNGDNYDDDPQGFGPNPPAVGMHVFQGPENVGGDPTAGRRSLDHFMFYNNDSSVRGNPVDPRDFLNYASGFWLDNQPLVDDRAGNGNGYPDGPLETTSPTNYMFPDFPNSCGSASCNGAMPPAVQSWDEICAGNHPNDRQGAGGVGPFSLPNGASTDFTLAVAYARDLNVGNTGSVCKLLGVLDDIRTFSPAQLDTMRCGQAVPVGREEALAGRAAQFKLYPNPTQSLVTLQLDKPLQAEGKLVLRNALGQPVLRKRLPRGTTEKALHVDAFSRGIYLLSIQTEGQVRTRRLILR